MNLLIDCQYFPSVTLYKILVRAKHVFYFEYEPYRKMQFRNRCLIAGADSVIGLSVPLLHGRDQRARMTDLEIDNRQPWQSRHWKTISSCYNRSPWFWHYRDSLHQLFAEKHDRLLDWNQACLEWTFEQLELDIRVGRISQPDAPGMEDARAGLRGKGRLEDLEPVTYTQVFQDRTGFIPHLSILDLLFCEGNRASACLLK